MARRIVHTSAGWGVEEHGVVHRCRHSLAEMLTGDPLEVTDERLDAPLLAPIDHQEVWAAGVTYQRSLQARAEESKEPDVYERVYLADRPELFFKSTPSRVVGPGGTGLIRSDSTWDVPEPEIVLVLDSGGRLFGYTIGDDLSSRSIEGDNPLYLPQAKVYDGACVVGPGIVPAGDISPPFDIRMTITRDGAPAFDASLSTRKMHRSFEELASWLFRGLRFPEGVLLMTGTGLVPGDDFTLQQDDRVTIAVDGIGTLEHAISVLGSG